VAEYTRAGHAGDDDAELARPNMVLCSCMPHFVRSNADDRPAGILSHGRSNGKVADPGGARTLRGLHSLPAHRIGPGLGLLSVPACVDRQPLQEISTVAGAFLRRI